MVYVRHRSRMVRQSVYEDLIQTLADNNWTGATPLQLLQGDPLTVVDFFPHEAAYQGVTIEPNTLAVDAGRALPEQEYEMGGMLSQEYLFGYAFYGNSDAVALALFQDLQDRYLGKTAPGHIALLNYNEPTPTLVVNMEVEGFQYSKAPEQVVPGFQMYFAEMTLTDYLDQE